MPITTGTFTPPESGTEEALGLGEPDAASPTPALVLCPTTTVGAYETAGTALSCVAYEPRLILGKIKVVFDVQTE